jgi:hypothetical protein
LKELKLVSTVDIYNLKIHILDKWLVQQVKSQYGGMAVDVVTTAL